MTFNLPPVSIVIPSFNEERYIAKCIKSVMDLDYPNELLEIIVVDNGSTDKTPEIINTFPIKALTLENGNVGAVRNYGAKTARGDLLVFLDADCVVDKDWLMRGVLELQNLERAVVGGQYLLRDSPSWYEKYWILDNSRERVYLSTLVGGCIFIWKETFFSVHGFDESLRSGEDSELTSRLIENGQNLHIKPNLSVVHLGFPSTFGEFVKRQIWHSSDYVTALPRTLKDKIFLITLTFMFGVILLVASVITYSRAPLILGILCMVIPITTLSIKRILRSKYKVRSIWALLSILTIDALYLLGRSLGILKSALYKIRSNS